MVPSGPEAEDQGGDYCSCKDKKSKGPSSGKGDGEGDQEAFKTDPSRLRTNEAGDTSSVRERDRGPQSQPRKQVCDTSLQPGKKEGRNPLPKEEAWPAGEAESTHSPWAAEEERDGGMGSKNLDEFQPEDPATSRPPTCAEAVARVKTVLPLATRIPG
ncbi:hypothetical protein H1C71_025591 [Ictidomys tridecemlineatus]|nr:hypothetical protein H1C71_025591 [Ictidomys tridecemlineatus]